MELEKYLAFVRLTQFVIEAIERLVVYGREVKQKREEQKSLQQRLFGLLMREDMYVNMPAEHPIYKLAPGKTYPDDEETLKGIFRSIYNYFRAQREFRYYKELGVLDIRENICSIGGPVSNGLIRAGMGYVNRAGGLMYTDKPETDLSLVFNLANPEHIEKAICIEKGGLLFTQPNWSIINKKTGELYKPDTRIDGYLETDYLLITVKPSNLTKEAEARGKVQGIFGACHGVGCKAFPKVLDDLEMLKKIDEGSKGSKYFQTVVKVTKIKHKKRESVPQEIEHIVTLPLR